MDVLVLEDEGYRQKLFKIALIGTNYKIVETARECIAELKEHTWDAVFLDHDLGGQQMVESGPGTGYEVACWLEEHIDRIPPLAVVHSLNIIGGPRMVQAIPGSTWLPGCWGLISVQDNGEIILKKREF